MADIFHYFSIQAPVEKVFESVSTPKGLNSWWSQDSKGKPGPGETYLLCFGPKYNWKAIISKYIPGNEFELRFIESDMDWNDSRVGFILADKDVFTDVQFYHTGWKDDNRHFRISNYCWAMCLRILRRNLEYGEEVPYKDRLQA